MRLQPHQALSDNSPHCVDRDYGLEYLNFRFWVGAWVFFILMLIVAFDLSAFVAYITRFTEESFAVLISLIFMFEAFKVSHL